MDFVEQEASEASSTEDSGEDSGAEIKAKKKKSKAKKRPKKIVDSSEEEDEDEELDGNLEGFIDDNIVEEDDVDGDEGSGPEGEKRKHEDSDLEEDLEDEDYDLLEENLGVKVQRKKKLKRIRAISDDEESGKEDEQQDDRDAIAREIFDDDGEEEMEPEEREEKMKEHTEQLQVGSDSGEESEDNFIVDDDGQPIHTQKKKKKKHIHDDQALQEAQDIFGVDFDFDEFDEYADDYSEAEDEDEEEDYENEEDEEGERKTKTSKKKKKKGRKTTIFEIFEPSDLERAHFTDQDQEIRSADMPERFQLRGKPVCPTEEGELEEEAEWIYKQAFTTPPVSRQDYWDQCEGAGVGSGRFGSRKGPGTVGKIKSALNFMRNQQFEVPFIAFYRKEYVEPELNINDLWKVYQADEKWMQLRQRKLNLVRLFEKMQTYQFDTIDHDSPLASHFRALTEEDIDRVKTVETIEELNDVYQHFLLYYGNDVPKMKTFFKNKKKREKEKMRELNPEAPEEGEDKDDEDEDDQDTLKQASRKSGYTMCVQAGLADLSSKFGLPSEKFGENLRDNYQRYDVEQEHARALDVAQEFLHGQFRTPAEALKGAGHMVAMQIAHDPLVRQVVRQVFYDRAMLTCTPTKKGIKEIDENHVCYMFKYLKNKPLKNFQNETFLQLTQAVDDGCMTYEIHMDEKDQSRACVTYFEEIRQLYHRDEFSDIVEEWNEQRGNALQRALEMILYPQMIREAKSKLLEEAKEHIVRACCRKLYNCLKVAPYQADQQLDDDEDDFDSSKGMRVLGISFSEDREMAQFGALIDGQGEVVDILRLANFNKRKNSWRADERLKKLDDMKRLKEFISTKKPHVIAVAALSRESLTVMEDVKAVVSELEQEQQMAPISVELVDDELSTIYSTSKKAENDYREYPVVLRHAISIARRLQDPLVEFAQLCNSEEDIMCLKYHPMQDVISKERLMNGLYLEFVNRVNEVGVDVNKCVSHPHTAPLVQFVCGLGPRKGYHLLKILKQNNSRLENRTQLVVMCHMGPKVFINCAGFIKIDTSALGDSTEAYVEVLDGSRVHPETYEWARKMAVDALEYDDTAEDANPAGALEEILENPERLKDLDLDAFADELERQGYGNKHITLYDIRAELNHRYKDLRVPFRSPTSEERFNMIFKETPNTFYIGKLVLCRVTGIAHRRPKGEQLDQANPVRNDETGLWQCPFCQKNDFPELSEVWNHFDGGECVGQPMGVKCRLENSITGFIHVKNLSDKEVTNPEDRVKVGMPIHARISKIDIDRFSVDLTSKTSDLVDKDGKWKPTKDPFYDYDFEEKQQKKEDDKKKQQARQNYVKRVIVHPQFHNVDYNACVKLMRDMEAGDVIIRPSSKGSDHLTCTWKVSGDILQHIDIREEGKENTFSLGRSLWIDDEEFEDLDEIIARYIQPTAGFARDLLNHKYYKDSEGGKREIMDKVLFEEKKKAPSKIPYYFSTSRQFPGKFMLSYLPRKTPRHEFVTVTPEGVRYRGQMFHSINACIRWFKEHFKDPIPGATPTNLRTPHGGSTVGHTPSVRGVDSVTLQRAAAGLPNSVFNTLAQVAGQTPMMGVGLQNPLQTPLMTPVMTPTVHPIATPSNHAYVTPGQAYATPAPSSLATPSLQTPQYQPTPRSQPWGGHTPQVTANPTPTPSTRKPKVNSPSSTEWAKMAEMWAKRKEVSKKRTPRSPYGGSTPGTPRGDATPLFDEL